MGQASLSASDPDFVIASGNGIDHIFPQQRRLDSVNVAILDPVQSALFGSEPCAIFPVNVNGTTRVRGRSLIRGVSYECAVSDAL
jgi:hypothetical protein